jgi:hypothetical protein
MNKLRMVNDAKVAWRKEKAENAKKAMEVDGEGSVLAAVAL